MNLRQKLCRAMINGPLIFILLSGTIIIHHINAKEETEAIVTMLTKLNFTSIIAEHDFVFVNFYAPWCGHSKALAPEFYRAAEELKACGSPVKFAKVDATEDDELAYEQQVRAYPTLKFFRNNVAIKYSGGREAKDMICWLNKELEPPVKNLQSIGEVESFLEEHSIAVVGFFVEQDTEKARLFNAVAVEMKDFVFGVVSNNHVIAHYDLCPDNIVLFKPHDEPKAVFRGPNDVETLKRFMQLQSLPLIMEFDHSTASKILRGPTKAFLLFFILNEDDQLKEYVEPLIELAKAYREHVLFVTVTYDDKDKKRAFEYFGIQKNETPTIRLIKLNEKDELIKFKPDTKHITIKTVDDFIQQYIEGCLKRHYMSQTLPDDWDEHPVKTLVASNFCKVAYDKQRTVLVEFYAPWCGHCKQLEPIFEQLATKYKDNHEIVIAKINGVSNEVENLKVTTFPTIKLFLRESNQMIDFDGARTLEGLVEFLEKNIEYLKERDEF